MPEYLAPGVYVEETSFRQKTIEGVSTSTTGFVGPCRFGPVNGEPELLTSFSDFERVYGGIDQLDFGDVTPNTHNYLAHAVRAYFEEGGRRLYVSRTFNSAGSGDDGRGAWSPDVAPERYTFQARHPGAAGNFTVTCIFKLSNNALHQEPVDAADPEGNTYNILRGVGAFDVVLAGTDTSPASGDEAWYTVESFFDNTLNRGSHRLRRVDDTVSPPEDVVVNLDDIDTVRKLTVTVIVGPIGRFGFEQSWEDLSLHPEHPNSLSVIFADNPTRRSTELYVPLIFETTLTSGAEIAEALMENNNLSGAVSSPPGTVADELSLDGDLPGESARSFSVSLINGDDGDQPQPSDYTGIDSNGVRSGLLAFEDVENISIVAAPGSSFINQGDTIDNAQTVAARLISHCERMRYRVAVLDSINGHIQSELRDYRSVFDSTRAALYYPWVRTFDPLTEQFIDVPPSGSVTGIYARNDVERGVHKAPANEVVRMASGLEFVLNKAQQEVLNPLGVNCLRFFEGRGYRIWGARTATSDPEWKYLNVRRYFAFLERSIELGTQWAVFENNGIVLWDNVRLTIEDFLFNEWKQNHLAGSKPDQAYFVRCDRSTITQNDLDNGRLVCHIGVAALKPAEFVIFRIGQKTADS
ncbi:MAG TPA: phage tail protein [Gammaproteobacteria bacterium]|nr:phage tail protein [Gammaproteobacteria bacterium]